MSGPFCYTPLRRSGCGRVTAFLLSLWHLLAWLVLRFDSPAWQRVLAERAYWYPHLANKSPTLGDPLRYLLQTIWLLLVRPASFRQRQAPAWWSNGVRSATQIRRWVRVCSVRVVQRLKADFVSRASLTPLTSKPIWPPYLRWLPHLLLVALTLALSLLCITEPFEYEAQLIFVLLLWGLALLIRDIPGRFAMLLLVTLSIIISCRYLYWRYTATLNWNSALDLSCGLILLAAETYSWLVLMLGYLQTSWPLRRPPVSLPADMQQWPTVDLLIPTYNEDLMVIRNTVYAARGIDWPADKLRIYLLDDGRRESFRQFAAEVGIGYITRPDNKHAKAGNLNYALTQIDGELVAIFDCDHIPSRAFLQLTVGWFLRDARLALVQTPHHFYSPDPFERNLDTFQVEPNEGELFYGLVQDGNDLWNAAFFCGSCAVLRRAALDDIGGFAVETVTEDAHTALRLHRQGWHSAYLRIPLAAGLATESLSAHIGQRIRWARGMVQIFRTDNPLLGRGLSIFQRLCYFNAMLHFLAGLPRLIFLTAPLAFLLLHAYIIYAPATMILLYVLPHMIHAGLANARLQGNFRKASWGEVYETVLAWYIAWPTTLALFSPKKGRFNVTVKGGLMSDSQFDWRIASPYLVLAGLNLIGLGFAVWRLWQGPANEVTTVLVSILWVLYNLLIIGAAVAVAAEVRQVRLSHRVTARLPVALRLSSGHLYPGVLMDYSDQGVGLEMNIPVALATDTPITLVLWRGGRACTFPGRVRHHQKTFVGVALEALDHQQRSDFVQCTFERANAWLDKPHAFVGDQPLRHFLEVLALGGRGYQHLYQYVPAPLRYLADLLWCLPRWLYSYCPRMPRTSSHLAGSTGSASV